MALKVGLPSGQTTDIDGLMDYVAETVLNDPNATIYVFKINSGLGYTPRCRRCGGYQSDTIHSPGAPGQHWYV